ncbi:MAG: glycosyltransferase family 4 protein [Tolypothrix carrinoi HA7290-LM1]|jgi:glycogen synthase|nr:glycosyltransferase family 4 protein [Tolypothrix carrinoi HA7290-LM1]
MPKLQKVAIFSKEYPPNVYGGSGVHVQYLSCELARALSVKVHYFGDRDRHEGNLQARGYQMWDEIKHSPDPRLVNPLDAFARSLAMAKDTLDADIVHCHDWSTCMGGFLAKKLWGVPLVLTAHSLEPLRPWKQEQLGSGGYQLSSWMEQTAIEAADMVIAVSEATRQDILRLFATPAEKVQVIYNGIDIEQYCKTPAIYALLQYGIDPMCPYVLFVGRITQQKGIDYLIDAIEYLDPTLQVVFCVGAPDIEELRHKLRTRIETIQKHRTGVFWLEDVPQAALIQFYSHAAAFCCPSIYEPFGLVNIEAMACGTAVVASAIGGIPEIVVHGETGLLVDLELTPHTLEPTHPTQFAYDLATALNYIATNPMLRETFGRNGRRCVEERFTWAAVAHQTLALYHSLLG